MRKTLLTVTALFGLYLAQAQDVVNWSFSARKIADKTYEIHLTPSVSAPWHIYSQFSPEGGARPTVFSFSKNPLLALEGKVKEEGKIVSKFEEVFEVTVKYFEGRADFVQLVKLKADVKTKLNGSVEFMACNDHQCLPPKTVNFSIAL